MIPSEYFLLTYVIRTLAEGFRVLDFGYGFLCNISPVLLFALFHSAFPTCVIYTAAQMNFTPEIANKLKRSKFANTK